MRSILPHPISHGVIRINWKFVPSASLGGDAFGYYQLDEDHFVICLIDVSGGYPPALLIGDTASGDSRATPLRTPNNVIGAMPNVAYQKSKHEDDFTIVEVAFG